MAYWDRRRGHAVTVYYYDSKQRKVVALPRKETAHLDPLPAEEIDAWVDEWSANSGRANDRGKRRSVLSTDALQKHFQDYQTYRTQHRNVGEATAANERGHWHNYIVRFFVQERACKNPKQWHEHTPFFLDWLAERVATTKTRKQIVQCLNRFGRYLKEFGIIKVSWQVMTPALNRKRTERDTPLPRLVKPKEILKTTRQLTTQGKPQWALVVWLGYFANLRPEETFALEKRDFLTGEQAAQRSQTYKRFRKAKLGSKLAVKITKAKTTGKVGKDGAPGQDIGPPKNYNSNGIVTIWSPAAAKRIGKLLAKMESGQFFTHHKRTLFEHYNKEVFSLLGITAHDLRRSSTLYMARTLGLDVWLLQDHVRHADLETLLLYARRPIEEETDTEENLDFSDVV